MLKLSVLLIGFCLIIEGKGKKKIKIKESKETGERSK